MITGIFRLFSNLPGHKTDCGDFVFIVNFLYSLSLCY